MRVVVASAHFNEDLSWVSRVNYPVKVYSKTLTISNFIPFNKVQEVPAYLKFIIDNYIDLPDYTFFVHGHEYSPHQNDSIINLINNASLDKPMVNINRVDWYNKYDYTRLPDWDWLRSSWGELFEGYLEFPNKLWFPAGAQFAVHRNLILNYPLKFFINAYDWCRDNKLENYISSRIFEYVWFYLFTKKEIYTL